MANKLIVLWCFLLLGCGHSAEPEFYIKIGNHTYRFSNSFNQVIKNDSVYSYVASDMEAPANLQALRVTIHALEPIRFSDLKGDSISMDNDSYPNFSFKFNSSVDPNLNGWRLNRGEVCFINNVYPYSGSNRYPEHGDDPHIVEGSFRLIDRSNEIKNVDFALLFFEYSE